MNRRKVVFINGFWGFFSMVVRQMLQFVIRIFTLYYIGIEVMGISATFTSILTTLSLAELGFQEAVVYYLYDPLYRNDKARVNQILMILKRVYEIVGVFFTLATLVCIPMLKYILKNVVMTEIVICYYIIMSLKVSSSYFFAYKRALLLADQKEYISKFWDCVFNIIFSVIEIIVIIYLKSYMCFLILQVIQTIISNITINLFCKRKYSYLCSCKFEVHIFKQICGDVKNVFMGKVAGYVYGATDNLIISSFIGTIYVGYLSNYILIISAIKQVIGSIFNAMTSIIGNMLVENTDSKLQEPIFRMYTFARYIIASAIVIPWLLFAEDIITILFGEQYRLPELIAWLLAIDLYIHIVYTPCCEYINGSGQFGLDKKIALIGASINVITSICFAFLIGMEGVLAGTVLSQLFFWLARSCIVYFKIFELSPKEYMRYYLKHFFWVSSMIIQLLFYFKILNRLKTGDLIIDICVGIILVEIINSVIIMIVYHNSEEQMLLLSKLNKRL